MYLCVNMHLYQEENQSKGHLVDVKAKINPLEQVLGMCCTVL